MRWGEVKKSRGGEQKLKARMARDSCTMLDGGGVRVWRAQSLCSPACISGVLDSFRSREQHLAPVLACLGDLRYFYHPKSKDFSQSESLANVLLREPGSLDIPP